MLPALLLLLAASPVRPFSEERLLLDRRLETLRRILPDGPHTVSDTAHVREIAEGARLNALDIQARPPVEAGARGDVFVDVSAVGRYADVDRFFRQAALSHRLIDVESLSLAAAPFGTVKLTALLRLPYWPLKAPLPAPPEGVSSRVKGVARPQAEAFLRDQALALGKSQAIAAQRRARRNPRLFLSELAAIVRDRPVVLTGASLGEEFLVRGMTVGEGPLRALETRFERGFFRVAEFLMARSGACHRFEARGASPVAGVDAELPLPAEDPFRQDDAPCRVDRDSGRTALLRGPNHRPNPKAPPRAALTLRLRDMDLADVFLVLHHLTGRAYLVDGDVRGRVSMDLSRASVEEVQAVLEKAGVRFSAPGPLQRASMTREPRIPALAEGAPKASFSLKRADVRELLAVMTEVDPALAALGPQGGYGSVSLWARELPLVHLRAGVLEAAGLGERLEEGRRILTRGAADEVVQPVASDAPERRLSLRPQDLTVAEFELAALASRDGERWTAYAYAPTGALCAYRPGDALFDGTVRGVESNDATLETAEGPLRVAIAALPK